MRIVVLGYLIRGPLGGMAWHHLQYLLGLHRLGHDVYFIEDSDDYPSCYDPSRGIIDTNPDYGLRFAADAFGRLGLIDRWAYYDAHTDCWHGPSAGRATQICRSAEVVLNISGVNPLRSWMQQPPIRVLIDTDPVFSQLRHLRDPAALDRARQHTHFYSFGENIASDAAAIPSDGLPWRATRQPIVLDAWPVTAGPPQGAFTTVMQWDSYPVGEFGGQRYGMKADSFGPYESLPARVGEVLEIALGSSTAPRSRLAAAGWVLRDPLMISRDPWTYQRYIQESKAEFSVAKQGYVISRSGWFSERSAGYLAGGRPVVVQDTGFTKWLRSGGLGVLAFHSPEEAVAAIDEVCANYPRHCQAARAIAEEYFDSRIVLTRLLDSVFAA